MRFRQLHRWDVGARRAAAIQETLRAQVILRFTGRPPRWIAGADVSYDRGAPLIYAAVVVLELPSFRLVESAGATGRARFPYIPGFLSFREAPVVLAAFKKLRTRPDLLLCDGQGIAHPRGFGLASHLGLILDLPSIGCAKSRLVGDHAPPGRAAGSSVPLAYRGRRVGAVVRTRDDVSPIYVSPGHRVGHGFAVQWTLACCKGRRLPEPTRLAHQAVNRLRTAARDAS
ncbi:MAG TPA: deoxyribonuclease V [Candidatus Polarisedimenticolia bacterium]|nr:deoxyribonuclease V [Candidatus Polarisedimenticolia bacterium]